MRNRRLGVVVTPPPAEIPMHQRGKMKASGRNAGNALAMAFVNEIAGEDPSAIERDQDLRERVFL